MSRVILVTGVSRDVAARVARSLAASGADAVVGVDVVPPAHDLGAATFVRADLRSPLLGRTLGEIDPDIVLHAALSEEISAVAGKEVNVLGSMQLLAACQGLGRLSRFIAVSTGAVYGSSAVDPARVDETAPTSSRGRSVLGRDAIEMEAYVRSFGARRPEVRTTILRFAEILGAGTQSRFARYISLPVVPKPAGFDARLQFLHPVDAVDACRHAIEAGCSGVFNVAAEDCLPLTQVIRIMGRPSVGVAPALTPAAISVGLRRRASRMSRGELHDLTYGRVMDVTRFADTGFVPHYSSRRAVEEFAALGTPGVLSADQIDRMAGSLGRLATSVGRATERWRRTPGERHDRGERHG